MAGALRHLCVAIMCVPAMTGCATPGRTAYQFAAEQYERWAREDLERAGRREAEAKVLAERGDQQRADVMLQSARELADQSRAEQLRADKDGFLGKWWPVAQ